MGEPQRLSPRQRILARRAAGQGRPPRKTWFGSVTDSIGDVAEGAWDSTKQIAQGTATLFKASQGNPMAAMELMQGVGDTVDKFQQNSVMLPGGRTGLVAEALTGVPVGQVIEDIDKGNYSKAAGRAAPAIGLGLLGAKATRMANAPKPVAAPVPRGPLALLPERTGPRFVAGEAGVADTSIPYRRHTGNPNPMIESGTPTLADVGEVVTLPPELAAQGYGPQGAPPISIGKQRTRAAAQAHKEGLSERARQPRLATPVSGRQQVTRAIEDMGGTRDRGPARQSPGTPTVEKLTSQERYKASYPPEDPRPLPSRDMIGDVGEVGAPPVAERPALPAGTQSKLRELGIPEENIRRMTLAQANKAIKAIPERQAAKAGDKIPKPKVGKPNTRLRDNFPGNQAVAETVAQAKLPRPYETVRDVDLQTLAKMGDQKAIQELAIRAKSKGGFVIGEDGVAIDAPDPSQPRLGVLDRLRDETGAVGPGADDLMRGRRAEGSAVQATRDAKLKELMRTTDPAERAKLQGQIDFLDSSILARLKRTLGNERGSVPLPTLPKIDFDAPIDAGGGKGNIFHRTVNEVFDGNFAKWVNARRATSVEGILKRREFADLDSAGMDGIHAFQAGIKSGRFKDVADYFTAKHDTLEAGGVKLGFRENYLPQLWDNSADEIFQVSKRLGLKPQFALERVLENYQAGIDAGLKPKFKSIGELMGWYEQRANKAIADREFFNHLRETKQILPESKAPQEWVTISPDHFPVQKFKTARGEHVTKNYKAPKPVADAINNYLEEGHGAFKWVGDKASLTKNIVLSAGVPGTGINAHGMNLAARNIMGRGIIRGGMEAAKYIVNPKAARRWLDENLASAPDAIKHGLTLTTEEHQIGTPGSVHLLREPRTKPGRVLNKGLNAVLKVHGKFFEDPLFQNIVPAMKLKHYGGLVNDFMKQGMSEIEAKKAAANTTNSLYGGINWEAMQRSRDLQNLLRGIVLAPDWLETQYRIGKGMTNTLRDPKNPRGGPWKRAAANLVGAYLLADVVNYTINGHHMWENEPGHALDIKAGKTGGKIRYIRPFGTSADFARLPFDAITGALQGDLSTTSNIMKNRRSTLARLGSNLTMNQDDFGKPIFGDDIYGRPQPMITQLGKAGREVGEIATPQYMSGAIDYATGRATSKEEALLGSVEAPVRYSRESTRPRSRNRPKRRRPSR